MYRCLHIPKAIAANGITARSRGTTTNRALILLTIIPTIFLSFLIAAVFIIFPFDPRRCTALVIRIVHFHHCRHLFTLKGYSATGHLV